jgi:uncharacterized damage-inducible protein DinB
MTPEISTYLDRLNDLRSKVWQQLESLDAGALNWKPLERDSNSLFVLATHSVGAEHGWIGELMGNEPRTRVRALEFQATGQSITELRERIQSAARESERILAGLSEDDLEQTREHEAYGTVTGRWIILHVIEHYAEHLGQMRLTRQLLQVRG